MKIIDWGILKSDRLKEKQGGNMEFKGWEEKQSAPGQPALRLAHFNEIGHEEISIFLFFRIISL